MFKKIIIAYIIIATFATGCKNQIKSPATPEAAKSIRGFSHGRIRLSDPVKLADYLLQNSKIWTPENIVSTMNRRKEQFVELKPTVPVIITYYTSWVDNKGVLHFTDDIYGQDKQMALKMFTNPQ
jgi:murein L,D-transpeptidase YcbB/YkuD